MQSKVSGRVFGLALCVLFVTLVTGAGKQPTRPYKITGEVIGTITSLDTATMTITFTASNVGQATHCGRYVNELDGVLSLLTLQGTSHGLFVCANGDEILWTGTIDHTTLTVTTVSGTGRFAGGTGGFVATMDNIVVDLATMTLSYSFAGAGEVTY